MIFPSPFVRVPGTLNRGMYLVRAVSMVPNRGWLNRIILLVVGGGWLATFPPVGCPGGAPGRIRSQLD